MLESVILSAVGIKMIALGDGLVSFKAILWVADVWKVTQVQLFEYRIFQIIVSGLVPWVLRWTPSLWKRFKFRSPLCRKLSLFMKLMPFMLFTSLMHIDSFV